MTVAEVATDMPSENVAQVAPLLDEYWIVKSEMVAPPFDEGASHDSEALRSAATPLTAVGAPGTVVEATGETLLEEDEYALVPTEFTAATRNT